MKMELIIGLDVSKAGARHHCLDASGRTVAKGAIEPLAAQAEGLVEGLGADPGSILVVAEATGMLHLGFCQAFARLGCQTVAVNPLYSRGRSQRNAIRGAKSDAVDAEQLAELGLREPQELLRRFGLAEAERVALRRFVSARKQVRSCLTNMLKHSGELASTMLPELSRLELRLTSAKLRRLLLRCPTPARIAELSEAELGEYVGGKAARLKRAASRAFGSEGVIAACSQGLLRPLIEQIEGLYRALEELDGKIDSLLERCVGRRPLELVKSISGFGEKTAAKTLAFLPPEILEKGSKRKVSRKLQALFGAEPRMRRSGKWKGNERISKRGVEIARTAIFQAAFCALRADPEIRAYYDRLKSRGKPHKQAIVDVMRKQIERLASVLIDDRPFTPARHENPKMT